MKSPFVTRASLAPFLGHAARPGRGDGAGWGSERAAARILGIDPSLTSTGAVLLVDGETHSADRWSTGTRGVDRLAFFDGMLTGALLEGVDYIALEGYSFASTGRAMYGLGELGGVLRLRAHLTQVPVVEIPPARWRKELLGRNLPKDQVRLEVWRRYRVEFPSLDVLEAWALAMTLHRRLLNIAEVPRAARRPYEEGVA